MFRLQTPFTGKSPCAFGPLLASFVVTSLFTGALASAQPGANPSALQVDSPKPTAEEQPATNAAEEAKAKRIRDFEERMTGSSLIGSFTMLKKNKSLDAAKPLTEERYDIKSVKKAKIGDYWIITARIRYGDHDLTAPVPVEVKWAGNTPIIILDKVPVPGLGTFDSRVLISRGRYAGTWQHDDVGGHLFGRLERTEELDKEESAAGNE